MATPQTLGPEHQGSRLSRSITGPLLHLFVLGDVLGAGVAAIFDDHRHFRVPAFVPVLGIASCVLLLTQQEGRVWWYGLGLLLVGVVLFAVARLTSRRSPAAEAPRPDDERKVRS